MLLESLGLDSESDLIYRTMLAHPDDRVAQLARRLGLSEKQIRAGLDQLSALALVRPSAHEESGFHVMDTETAMEVLLARQQAELAAQQMRVEAARAAAAQFIVECSSLRPRLTDQDSEYIVGPDAIRERLASLGKGVEREIMTLAPGGAHSVADLAASREPNAELLSRGVHMRTIYLSSVRNHGPTLDHITRLNERGAQIRTAVTLPVRMIIMDRKRAVLPIDTDDASKGAVIVNGPGIVAALCALFDGVWESATPLGVQAPRMPHGASADEREILQLLANGLTDEAIAKRLGVSPRTARRIAADLMKRLRARSRFQAGVHAVQDGWLPATR